MRRKAWETPIGSACGRRSCGVRASAHGPRRAALKPRLRVRCSRSCRCGSCGVGVEASPVRVPFRVRWCLTAAGGQCVVGGRGGGLVGGGSVRPRRHGRVGDRRAGCPLRVDGPPTCFVGHARRPSTRARRRSRSRSGWRCCRSSAAGTGRCCGAAGPAGGKPRRAHASASRASPILPRRQPRTVRNRTGRSLLDRIARRVWFVDVATVTDPGLFAFAVAAARHRRGLVR